MFLDSDGIFSMQPEYNFSSLATRQDLYILLISIQVEKDGRQAIW